MSKNVLVTGGSGFIGSNLVDRLVLFGCNVHVIDDLSTGKVRFELRDVNNQPLGKGGYKPDNKGPEEFKEYEVFHYKNVIFI